MSDGVLSIQLILYGVALCVSGMPLALAIASKANNRRSWTNWYIVFQSVLMASTISGFFNLVARYLFSDILSEVFVYIFDVFEICTMSFVIVLLPYFVFYVIAKPWRGRQRILYYPFGVICFACGLSGRIAGFEHISSFCTTLLFLCLYLSCMALLMANLKTIEEKSARAIGLTVFITSLCLIPATIVAFIFPVVSSFAYPVYILAFSIIMIVYFGILFKQERRRIENKPKMTLESLSEYKISEREFSVIQLVTDGLTNKEIASKLNISVNTVNNHVANIFEKMNVKSRMDLLNLLKEGPWD